MELVLAVLIAFGPAGGLVLNRWWLIPAWSMVVVHWAVLVAAIVGAGALLGLLTRRLARVLARSLREPSRRIVRQ